jgi:hypothetical protein
MDLSILLTVQRPLESHPLTRVFGELLAQVHRALHTLKQDDRFQPIMILMMRFTRIAKVSYLLTKMKP